ncbi:MAG: type I secretion C-terminal target domain-containing protein [Okeania sp. SIO2H7]|nr:type I secretion C-terminal target domain-containing protein [Okeania sp. SIO2H7]
MSEVITLSSGDENDTVDAGFFDIPEPNPEPNIINGTSGMDMITGTSERDIITGFEGMDMITGGGGNDDFVYTSTWDQLDYIQDFQTGSDRLVFTDLLQNGTDFYGGDPVAQGYLIPTEYGPYGTLIQVDPDGSAGPGFAENMVFLTGVSSSNGNAFNPTTDLLI